MLTSKPNTKQSLVPVEPPPVVGLEVVVGGGTSECEHDFQSFSLTISNCASVSMIFIFFLSQSAIVQV